MNEKKSYIIGGIIGFVVLIVIAVFVIGGAYKMDKLLEIPETVNLAKITKDGNTIKVTGDELKELRQAIVDLEVREYGIEEVNKYDGIKIQFYENDREGIWFRIIDKETIWDYSEALTKGIVIVYKTDVDLLELISKY